MPYSVKKDESSCPASEPWAVVKDDDGHVMGCHETEEEAQQQIAALHAQESNNE